MPFKSKRQARFMFSKHPAMAKRWAAHTPDMKKLPEKAMPAAHDSKPSKKDEAKQAFVAAFLRGCAAAGVTDPAGVEAAAVKLAAVVRAAHTKSAATGAPEVAGAATGLLTNAALAGSIGLPLVIGAAGGNVAGRLRNQMDMDDMQVLRLLGEANAHRRRTAQLKTDNQVRKLLASDPRKYVQLT